MDNKTIKRQINEVPEVFINATFDELKGSLIDFYKSQDEFKDYDFEGSRSNILASFLAYAGVNMQQFANSALMESFIRTASLRSSVVQHAQDNGYRPSGKSAAITTLMVHSTEKRNPTSIRIPRGTKFLADSRNGNVEPLQFVSMEDVVSVRGNDNTYQSLIKIAQGRLIRQELSFDPDYPILIRDPNIDRNNVRIWVDGAEWSDFTKESMVNGESTSTIFYMRETIDGFTEIFFGEGQITKDSSNIQKANYIGGLKPIVNSNIVIEYLRTDGDLGNGAKNFSYADTIPYFDVIKVVENFNNDPDFMGAIGGGDPEDIERIRELAPIMRETQNRCVTAADYEAFVSARFGSIVQAVQCFTDRNKAGYAFLAIKPKSGLILSTVQREDIQNYLEKYNVATITPSVINPNYLFLKHNVKVTYDLNKLIESEQWLRGRVIDQMDKYYRDEVEIFNKSFHKSKMLTYIDAADTSILGSSATISMIREITNFYNTPMIGIKYYNSMNNGTLKSNYFEYMPNDDVRYNIRLVGTKQQSDDGKGLIILGPFRDGDIQGVAEYKGTDFEKMNVTDSEGRNKYYSVGELNYISDYIYWHFGVLNVPSGNFVAPSIELEAEPTEDNIFTRDGSLIVFENDLRPQYTEIKTEAVTQ